MEQCDWWRVGMVVGGMQEHASEIGSMGEQSSSSNMGGRSGIKETGER